MKPNVYTWIDITHENFRKENHLPRFIVKIADGKHTPTLPEEIIFSSDDLGDVQREAKRLNQISFDCNVRDKVFTRYEAGERHYRKCFLSEEDARSFGGEIISTPEVMILHQTNDFALWSDAKFSRPVQGIPNGGCLSKDAVGLISAVRGADGGSVEGGLLFLTKISSVMKETDLEVGPSRGVYAAERIQKLDVEWVDGTTGNLFVHTAGYFEGYSYEIYQSLDALTRTFQHAPGVDGITEFPPIKMNNK